MYMLYCSLLHSVPLLKGYSYYTPTPRRGGGYTVLPLSVRPRYFSSHFSQQLSMAEIWYLVTSFIYVCHIVGSVFGPVRFLLPVCRLCWFLYTLNIPVYANFSSHLSQQLLITVWVPVRCNWCVYIKFVGTLLFPIIDCQNRKGSM